MGACSSTSTALSDTRSVADESTSKRKEAENFESEPWPHASKFSSCKVSFRREVISGSTHPRSISEWFAEIDLAAGMEDLDHSGYTLDEHQIDFETLDSKVAKGIMKIIPGEFQRKINFLEETQYKNKRPILTDRQSMFQVFFFIVNKTQEHTMNLSDLLNVELRNDNLQMSNQAWEETLLALGIDLDGHVLENLCERQH